MTSSRSGGEKLKTSKAVLDAYLLQEPGAEQVATLTIEGGAAMSAVNVAEVVGVLVLRGATVAAAKRPLADLRLDVHEFSESQAYVAASLTGIRTPSRRRLSLGDRACIALAAEMHVPAITADREWAALPLPAEVVLIR